MNLYGWLNQEEIPLLVLTERNMLHALSLLLAQVSPEYAQQQQYVSRKSLKQRATISILDRQLQTYGVTHLLYHLLHHLINGGSRLKQTNILSFANQGL